MFTQYDVIISVIVLILITMSFFKGGIRSILGMVKWYGAAILTLIFYPYTKLMVEEFMQPSEIINGIAVFLVYVVAVVVLSIINRILIAAMGDSVGGFLDKLIGALVGFTIGYIIAATIHFSLAIAFKDNKPDWFKNGKLYVFTEHGSNIIAGYLKDAAEEMGQDFGSELPEGDTDSGKEAVEDGFEDLQDGVRDKLKDIDNSKPQMNSIQIRIRARELKEQGYTADEIKEIIKEEAARAD